MTAGELLAALNRAGATVELVDGEPRLRGRKISDELKAELRRQRQGVLEEVRRQTDAARNRWGQVPPPDTELKALLLLCPPEKAKEEVMAYVMRQPRPVHAWVMARANDYYEKGCPHSDCEWRACADAVAWQRNSRVEEALKFVVGLPTNEEIYDDNSGT